jgi:SAM-dependent methyltransferase
VGCGQGRHAVALALRGHAVTGLDLSAFLLGRARELAAERGASVTWVRRDMRDLGGLGPFDACVCLHTAFGFFEGDGDGRVLEGVASVLEPGGALMLDLDNPFPLVRRLPCDVWNETPGQVTCESVGLDPLRSRFVTRRLRRPTSGGRQEMPPSSVRLYYPHEVASLLGAHGFEVEGLFGALRDEPYDWQRSARMVWTARRP